MKKNEFNELFRRYTKEKLTPTVAERELVSKIYNAVQDVLSERSCLQIGSYPRFTAISPPHDLDILYIIDAWPGKAPNPNHILLSLKESLNKAFRNPTSYAIAISAQTHSITIAFTQGKDEKFSVDIVPAYIVGKNEFSQDTYMVPEILIKNHIARRMLYEEISSSPREMNWLKSDPRGYIEIAKQIDQANNDFRKTVKFIKAWKAAFKKQNEKFKLKSFHVEMVISKYFLEHAQLDFYDAVFEFFYSIPQIIVKSQFSDRGEPGRKIDEYIDKLTEDEKEMIIQARDNFLIKLENFTENNGVEQLFKVEFYERKSSVEKYLFDYKIPVLVEKEIKLGINGNVLQRTGGFREKLLDTLGLIEIDRKIQFRLANQVPGIDLYKWKVKNDDSSIQPRGEITDHTTLHDPEHTKYKGRHYVECYAIKNGVCVAKARQNVELKPMF